MANTPYYYLVAGLPDLRLKDASAPVLAREFVADIEEQLLPEHLEAMQLLLSALEQGGEHLEALEQSELRFLREWALFERTLRNLLAALQVRRHELPAQEALRGDDWLTGQLRRNTARDFGIGREFAHTEQVLQIHAMPRLFEREQALDQLRWDFIDELNTFSYFDIDQLLGFVIKLHLLKRYEPLRADTGGMTLSQWLQRLELPAEAAETTSR